MVRPKKDRIVRHNPDVVYFKPRGIPLMRLEEVTLTVDECEAIRLADLENLSQEDAGEKMGISRATFGRIIQQARKNVADAIINGKAIRIEGGNYRIDMQENGFLCSFCGKDRAESSESEGLSECPVCKGYEIKRQ
ncbi:DUF134 domain-containing protein [Desulforegula conservatrix]|uniref:DUF134 domain-containing protein n=1 Tax=Desulforegula conservatrix TaxID=153026 RepID=UPI0004059A18|nr:DUF134 domain-containing protein [Desulforegula conservatrix]